jgi:hypothetical protein
LTGKAYSHNPVDLTEEELNALPTILIQIAGDEAYNQGLFKNQDPAKVPGLAKAVDPDHPYDIIWAVPPSHYMEWDTKQNKYIARFYVDESSGSVLGGNAMMGHDVYFNIDEQRIGLAESDCDYTNLIKEGGFPVDGFPEKNPPATPATPPPGGEPPAPTPSTPSEPSTPVTPSTPVPPSTPITPSTPASPSTPVKPGGGTSGGSGGFPHDHDTPSDDINNPTTIHPALDACSDWKCQGFVAVALLSVCLLGICCGRCYGRRVPPEKMYHTTELEVPTMNNYIDEHDAEFGQYKDDPEDEVAPPGTGYKDEPETPEVT